jgi:orotate phosphoribosyltransferase
MGEVLDVLRAEGLVYADEHFVYTKGDHGSAYVNLRPLYPETEITFWLMRDLVRLIQDRVRFDVVIGPDFGGNELAEMVGANAANESKRSLMPVRVVRTRKRGKGFMVHPGRHYEKHLRGCRAFVVDDVFTTGGSVKKVINLIKRHGGRVVAVGGVIDRGGLTAETFDVEVYETLERVPLKSFPASDCPLCEQGVPMVVNLGHGSKFQAANPDYHGGFKTLG